MIHRPRSCLIVFLVLSLCKAQAARSDDTPAKIPVPIPQANSKYIDAVTAHLNYVTEHSLDEYGDQHTAMWLSSIDLKTNQLPKAPPRETSLPANCFLGASLYWDQPTIVAAMELSRRCGCRSYEESSTRYIKDYFARCFDLKTNQLRWGNSDYFEVQKDQPAIRKFPGASFSMHTPAWEVLWNMEPQQTLAALRSQIQSADSEWSLASKAIRIESACWLSTKVESSSEKAELVQKVLQLAEKTSIKDQPGIGMWIRALVRATELTAERAFQRIAERSLVDWLEDSQLAQKRDHQEPNWRELTQLAESSLELSELTQTHQALFRRAASDRIKQIESQRIAGPRWRTAEDFGRVIHFLLRAGEILEPQHTNLAKQIADDAMNSLYAPKLGMFRSHVGEDRCDSVDGPGLLLLALLYLDDGSDPTQKSMLRF